MTWTDKIQEFGAMNWAVISLLLLNFVLIPFQFFSGHTPEYSDGDYPSVELLMDEHSISKMDENPHTMPQEKHGSHAADVVDNSHDQQMAIVQGNMKNEHGVTSHNGHEVDAENQHNTKQNSGTHIVDKKTQSSDPLAHICYEVGPLKSDDEQIKLRNLIEIKGMFASIKYTRSNENLGYWVFIPPLRSKPLARLKVEELKLNGFKDVVLLTRNEPINAVSLGVFKDQKNAYKHMLRAQSLGFDAKMDIRYQSLGEMWLSVEATQGKDLNDEGWGELIKDYPHVQIHSVNCP